MTYKDRITPIVDQVVDAHNNKERINGGYIPKEGAFIPELMERWDNETLNNELLRLNTHPANNREPDLTEEELANIRKKIREQLGRNQ